MENTCWQINYVLRMYNKELKKISLLFNPLTYLLSRTNFMIRFYGMPLFVRF